MYADDTCFITPLKINTNAFVQNDEISHTINLKLKLVQDWLTVNKLSLNVSKTKYMLFRYPQKHLTQNHIPLLKIYDKPLVYTDTFKFLGLHLDKCLTWNNHVHEVSNKISKACGTLFKLKQFLPSNVLFIIYNSLILPHLSYCITSWGT